MALARVKITHVSRSPNGAATAGSLSVYHRSTAGAANGALATLYNAASGGSTVANPVTADANGRYEVWVPQAGPYNLVEVVGGVTLPTIYWEASLGVWESWNNVGAFTGSWVNYGSGFAAAAYSKNSEGMVKLKGLIKSGTVGSAAFTLPAGYRPTSQLLFSTPSNGTMGRTDVTSAGLVTPNSPTNNTWVCLDPIYFRAEA